MNNIDVYLGGKKTKMFFKDFHFLYTSLSNQGTFENDI